MTAYYNEIDLYAAEWLRNLIKAGLIPDGEVDTRSIVDVAPDDLRAFTQCHFFAGIGGWGHALRLAGWPDDRPIWTGSCPCQPFSVAGKGAGTDDPRHLWPHFHRLITAVRPPVVMGEQVAGAAGYGWLDGVRADLEGSGYSSRAADIPALAVNAPHIRQRLYWVALDVANTSHHRAGGDARASGDGGRSTLDAGPEGLRQAHRQGGAGGSDARSVGHMADASIIRREEREREDRQQDTGGGSQGGVDFAGVNEGNVADAQQHGRGCQVAATCDEPQEGDGPADQHGGCGGSSSFWDDHIWLSGADGKSRRSKSGLSLLVNGVSGGLALVRTRENGTEETHIYNRIGALRAFGNAIVAPLAKEVIIALMEVLNDGKQSLQENR